MKMKKSRKKKIVNILAVLFINGCIVAYALYFSINYFKLGGNASGPCIITVNGKQYDVDPLYPNGSHPHSGGTVWTCGKDNTSIFESRHGTDWGLISQYLYHPPTKTPTPTPSPTPTATPTPTPTQPPPTSPPPTTTIPVTTKPAGTTIVQTTIQNVTVSATATPTMTPTITPTITVTPSVTLPSSSAVSSAMPSGIMPSAAPPQGPVVIQFLNTNAKPVNNATVSYTTNAVLLNATTDENGYVYLDKDSYIYTISQGNAIIGVNLHAGQSGDYKVIINSYTGKVVSILTLDPARERTFIIFMAIICFFIIEVIGVGIFIIVSIAKRKQVHGKTR